MNRASLITLLILVFSIPATADIEVIETKSYSYDAHNRRDPFARRQPQDTISIPGIAGMPIAAVDLQGIVLSPDGKERYALVLGTDNQGYTLNVGTMLLDGRVKRIDPDRVVFLKESSNPLDINPYTQVVKRLDPEE